MGLMDKFKNLFTEEVEEEVEVEPIKKEVMQVEIPSPAPKRNTPKVEVETLDEPEVVSEPKKEEYKFPFFDDEDFHSLETKVEEKPKKEKKSSYQRNAYKGETKEVYSPVKEDKRSFKPTPIISPVYGILDKNYQKEDIKAKTTKLRSYYNPKEATVDEIRNKAFGTLEDDIETTLFGPNQEMFDEKDNMADMVEDEIKLSEDIMEATIPAEEFEEAAPRHGADDDLTDLLEAELSKNEEDTPLAEEPTIEEEKPRKISDSELFSMIDSMYQKGDKE